MADGLIVRGDDDERVVGMGQKILPGLEQERHGHHKSESRKHRKDP